eukprot:m.115139 g.115139  ORF g.115139 m.115139 type:complete len:276 (-) comp16328_c0_seq3:484-1311(-)
MRLIDCHAHLTDPELAADLDELLTGAAGQGVVRIVAVAEDVGDVTPLLALRDKAADKASLRWPAIDVCIGIHPCKAVSAVRRAGTVPALLESLRDLVVANRSSIVGIGECGLDYTPKVLAQGHGAEQVKEMQLAVLAGQARLSAEFDLPLNVHSRSAGHHAIDFLRQHQVSRAVFHAFDGRPVHAERGVEAGFMFSVPPIVVRSPQTVKMIKRLPLDALLLETDAPALAPEKQARNVPANLEISCMAIAEHKGVTVEQVADTTTASAARLFGLSV